MSDQWAALDSYQSCLSAPLLITSFDLVAHGIICNLIGIVQHVDHHHDPERVQLVLTDYGTVSVLVKFSVLISGILLLLSQLNLWRNQAQLVKTIGAGCVILATEVSIKFNTRYYGSLTNVSRLFNLKAPVSSPSLIGFRAHELLKISSKMFPRSEPLTVNVTSSDQKVFDSLEEAYSASTDGIYIGLARIRVRLPLRTAAETAASLTQRHGTSFSFQELPVLINDHLEGVATANVVRILCADLSPGNSPFCCKILIQPELLAKTVAFTLVSISF